MKATPPLAPALVLVLLACAAPAATAGVCPGAGGTLTAAVSDIAHAKTCAAASAKMDTCESGPATDVPLAAAVVARCEADFLPRLSPGDGRDYRRQMDACGYAYAANQGALFESSAASCRAAVAERFARNPRTALKPARASFDCAKARTPLERSICADDTLGQADIILAGDYTDALRFTAKQGGDTTALVASERRWLAALPTQCHVQPEPSRTATACLTRAFEARFAAFNDCDGGGEYAACLNAIGPEPTRKGGPGDPAAKPSGEPRTAPGRPQP